MSLDLRVPIGLLFGLLGLLLAGFGVLSDPGLYEKSLGINVNLAWGAVMLAFGLGMLGLAWRAQRGRE
jgi:hypothetical protein